MGAMVLRPETWPEQRLVAQSLIQRLGAWMGTDAIWIPGAALVLTLVAWQFASHASWRLRGWVPPLMIIESLVLTPPLFVLGRLLQQTGGGSATETLRVQIVLALGAGIYEELVFRLYLISMLTALLTVICRVSRRWAIRVAVVVAALAFAGCHFGPIGSEHFSWPLFAMLTLAGAYLSVIFAVRGLGVATGCHAAYNLISVLLSSG
jgi:membrane protease YdiL (CAAX protease family)